MYNFLKVILVVSLGLISNLVLADDAGNNSAADISKKREALVEKRQKIQQERIGQGVKSGELTPAEAARLERQEARIEKAEKKAMADGEMSKGEFRKIQKMQNMENRRIFRNKHNGMDEKGQ
jgi:CRISPR/Cas system-associated endoribonuclease Cas2